MDSLEFTKDLQVGTLRKYFRENFYTTLRVYKNVNCRGQLAEDYQTLSSLISPSAKGGLVTIDSKMRVGEFEKMFADAWGIGVQVANVNNTDLLDNNLTFQKIAEPYLAQQAKERAAKEAAAKEKAARELAEGWKEMAKLAQGALEDQLYNQYEKTRQELYHAWGEKFIKDNQNVSVKDFSAYYCTVLMNSNSPRESELLQKLAAQTAPKISSAQRRAKMDGKVDMRAIFKAERERLEQMVIRTPEYRDDIDIRANFPDLADKADEFVAEMKKAEKYQPLFMLLCIIGAIFCLPLIFEGIDAIVVIMVAAIGGGLYLYFKKFKLEKCRDWNPVSIWKRFMANRKNK